MGQNKKFLTFIQNIFKVAMSNFFILLAGILTGFIIPKIMRVTDYGYYKTFTLYISYSSIFRFGIVDGVYLLYGGKTYDELNKDKFKFFSQTLMVIEAFVSLVLIIVCVVLMNNDYKFIFAFVSLYIWSFNMTSYYQVISQITGRFSELSFRNFLQAIVTSVGVIFFWSICLKNNTNLNYENYIIFYVLTQFLLTFWYIYTYRDISFGGVDKKEKNLADIFDLCKLGIPLLLSNICATLLLNIDRQFVNVSYSNTVYAKYAFAYNLLSFVTVATSAISTVIYPILKRVDRKNLQKNYVLIESLMLVLVFAMLVIYFPLEWFINCFLEKYSDSLEIFAIIFPGLAMSTVITVVMHNYYKTLGKNFEYFLKSLTVLLLSILANFIANYFWHKPSAISIASIVVMFFWYMLIESYFIKEFKIRWLNNLSYLVVMISLFYLSTNIFNSVIGLFIYLLLGTIITFFMQRDKIDKVKKIIS